MKKQNLILIAIFYLGLLNTSMSCGKDSEPANNNNLTTSRVSGEWLIPTNEVFEGGPGKDGIPALSNPEFTGPDEALYMSDSDLVLGLVHNGIARAFPHNILDWHEIVNDSYGDLHLSVIYCPLTGTGTLWNRNINGNVTTFGVSGLLYNSNIIPYDRETDSNWSQIMLKAVNGKLKGENAEDFFILETRWDTWKEMYPKTRVLSDNTGYNRDYDRYPYGDYRTSSSLFFPVSNEDNRLHRKERVLGVLIDGNAKAFSIEEFGSSISLIHDTFNEENLVIAGSKEKNFIVAFKTETEDGNTRDFTAVQNKLPVIMKDEEGTLYDLSGQAVDGPGKGNRLVPATQFMGYWFAWAAFYPEIKLY